MTKPDYPETLIQVLFPFRRPGYGNADEETEFNQDEQHILDTLALLGIGLRYREIEANSVASQHFAKKVEEWNHRWFVDTARYRKIVVERLNQRFQRDDWELRLAVLCCVPWAKRFANEDFSPIKTALRNGAEENVQEVHKVFGREIHLSRPGRRKKRP